MFIVYSTLLYTLRLRNAYLGRLTAQVSLYSKTIIPEMINLGNVYDMSTCWGKDNRDWSRWVRVAVPVEFYDNTGYYMRM